MLATPSLQASELPFHFHSLLRHADLSVSANVLPKPGLQDKFGKREIQMPRSTQYAFQIPAICLFPAPDPQNVRGKSGPHWDNYFKEALPRRFLG